MFQILKGIIGRRLIHLRKQNSHVVSNPKRHYRTKDNIIKMASSFKVSNPKRHYRTRQIAFKSVCYKSFQILKGIIGLVAKKLAAYYHAFQILKGIIGLS